MSTDSNEQFLKFAKPFVDAARSVFETMVFTKIEPQKPEIRKDNIAKGDISSVLGLSGTVEKNGQTLNYRAQLVLSWNFDTYYKIASSMLYETYTEYCPDIADVGGELANMIMGNAKRDVAQMGFTTNKSIPTMVVGENHTVSYPNGVIIIVIPMQCAFGNMYMEICYKEGDD